MEKTRALEIKYVAVMVLAVASVALVAQMAKGDVARCREIFQGLVNGKASVQKRIDWERLKALDVDVGATYAQLPDEKQRAWYRRAFVESFAKGFAQTKATARDFIRWRVHERTGEQVVIAADYPGKQKTLLLAIPAAGRKKLEVIQWQ